MKMTIAILASLLFVPAAQAQRLQLDHLDRLGSQASNSVNLTLDPTLLRIAAGLLGGNRQDNAALGMLEDLQGIYIRSFEFDRDNAYAQSDVDAVRKQLASPGWSPLVQVDSTGDREGVQIYSWREGDASRGMAILVAEPRELTVVNIVGSIDLTRLGALQGQFGIPRLPDATAPGRGRDRSESTPLP
jgi:hypothetical protein